MSEETKQKKRLMTAYQPDTDPLQVQIQHLIDSYKPTPRQKAFIEFAEICIHNHLITITSWIEATRRAGKAAENEEVIAVIPEIFRHEPMTYREWRMWSKADDFDQWFWSELPIQAVSKNEIALIDRAWVEAVAKGVAEGNPESLRIYSKRFHTDEGGGAEAKKREELYAWAQPKESGWKKKIPEA